MSRRLQENVVALLLLAFFVAVLVTSLGYGPRARLVPVPIATLGIILVLFQIAWQNLRAADSLNFDLLEVLTKRGKEDEAEAKPAKREDADTGEARRIVVAVAMVALLVAMVLLAGPIPSIFVFTAGYFVLSGHFKPGKALFAAALFTGVTFVVFVEVLQIQMYNGYLEPVVEILRRL